MQPSTVSQEPNFALSLMYKLADFAINSKFTYKNSNGCSPVLSNFACFDGKKVNVKASLSFSDKGVSNFRDFLTQFNSVIRFHCEKIPIGFASIGLNSCEDSNGLGGNGFGGVEDEGLPLDGVVSKNPKKVLILMSDTGGGHRASAEAIKAAFYEEFGDEYQVFVTDLWTDHTPWPFNQLPRSYNFLVKHGSLWRVTYYASAPKVIHQSNFAATSAFIARFHKLVTRCYCPTDEVVKRALKAGLQSSQIKVYGLPVRPSFVKAVRPKDELRKDLGMDEDLPAVLLMGGGEGMGPIEATARALGNALYDENLGGPVGQVLVICGRNKKLASRLQSIDWKIPVQAGPGTIAEAMIRGLPIILNGYIAGQEVGNIPYVVENGCGKFSKSPKQIASIVSQWFGPKADELHAMSQNALRLARPDAVFKIVHDMDELVRQKRPVPQYSLT